MNRKSAVLALIAAIACTSPGSARQVPSDSGSAEPVEAAAANTVAEVSSGDAGDSVVRDMQRRADRSRIIGDTLAPVWMVEVSDFQCPYCSRFHVESYAEIHREYIATGRVKLAYVNFPLPMHEHAWPAAEAALCAGAQGRFWEMHDALFRTQAVWSAMPSVISLFDSTANGAGVKLPAFQRCMRDRVMRGLVQQDFDRGQTSGVRSTPTFFIGDTAMTGAQPIAEFRRVLDAALARAARGRGSR